MGITENWKTSIVGGVVLAIGVYLGITGQLEWTNLWPFVGTGIGLLIAKDGDK